MFCFLTELRKFQEPFFSLNFVAEVSGVHWKNLIGQKFWIIIDLWKRNSGASNWNEKTELTAVRIIARSSGDFSLNKKGIIFGHLF